jgi:hypothetical protein
LSINLDLNDANVKVKMAELPTKMLEFAKEVLLDQAHVMAGYAQIYCPVDTGSLRDSIRVEHAGNQVKVRAGGYVTNPRTGRLVNYAGFQEQKTQFMRMAYDEIKPTIAEMIKANVVQKINE